MVQENLVYDPVKDLAPVDQFGFVDLRSSFVNGSVPGDLSFSEEDYNGVSDPASLMFRSKDVFESIRNAQHVVTSRSEASEGASASSGAETE